MTTTTTPALTQQQVGDLQPGQHVTEVDTPLGPFYRVVRVGKASLRIADLETGFEVTTKGRPTHVVLAYSLEASTAMDTEYPTDSEVAVTEQAGAVDAFLAKRAEDGYVPNARSQKAATARQTGLDAKQAAGTVDRVKGRKSGDPRHDRAATGLATQLADAGADVTADAQRCTGACGQVLPLVKFPTVHRKAGPGRGTECRTCRDTRRGTK